MYVRTNDPAIADKEALLITLNVKSMQFPDSHGSGVKDGRHIPMITLLSRALFDNTVCA